MKVFMITWGLFCVLVIVGLFIAYATDNFSGVFAPQSRSEDPDKSGQVGLEAEEDCSPCEEKLKRLRKAIEQAERERKVQAAANTTSDTQ